MKWIIILLAFIGSWEQMKAQQNPIILNEKNVTDLTTAADWDKLIDTWNYVPLENSDNSRLGSIETCYIYGDYLFIKDYHDGEMRMMQFKLTGDFMHRVGIRYVVPEHGIVLDVHPDPDKGKVFCTPLRCSRVVLRTPEFGRRQRGSLCTSRRYAFRFLPDSLLAKK